jgi:uncharacterized protein YihD (DUF1040 family)
VIVREPERIDVMLDLVKKIWKMYPDLRLCQLVVNVAEDTSASPIFYLEDKDLEEKLRKRLADNFIIPKL